MQDSSRGCSDAGPGAHKLAPNPQQTVDTTGCIVSRGGGDIRKQLSTASGMKLLYGAAIAISVIVVLAPATVGLITTEENFRRQATDYGDDGHRYIIADIVDANSFESMTISAHSDVLMALTDSFATSEQALLRGSDTYMRAINVWSQQAEFWGWSVTTVTDSPLRTLVTSQADTAYVALLDRSGVAVPYLVTDADSIFVTAYEGNTGKVLYRRNAFLRAWTGLALGLRPPEADARP